MSVEIPTGDVDMDGDELAYSKNELVRLFETNPNARAALDQFGLKVESVFIENATPRLDIVLIVNKDTHHQAAEAQGLLSGLLRGMVNKVALPPSAPLPVTSAVGAAAQTGAGALYPLQVMKRYWEMRVWVGVGLAAVSALGVLVCWWFRAPGFAWFLSLFGLVASLVEIAADIDAYNTAKARVASRTRKQESPPASEPLVRANSLKLRHG